MADGTTGDESSGTAAMTTAMTTVPTTSPADSGDDGSGDTEGPDSSDDGTTGDGTTGDGTTGDGTTGDGTTGDGTTDDGTTDDGTTDSGSTDSGSTDGGSTDSGSTDGGSTDSGSTDSGSTDGGSTGSGSSESGSSSGGTMCGDGMAEGGEDCDMADLLGNDCLSLGMGFTAGTLACGGDCSFDTTGCSSVPWPGVGDVIVTEIMQNPSTLLDADGEYFELYNTTATSFQLANCTVNGSVDTFDISGDLVIAPSSYVTFATPSAADQGFTPDQQWTAGFGLNNGSDMVQLVCDGVEVDVVAYDNGATFPDPNGASMSLDPGSYDATSNDSGANWCESTSSYNGDFGTPGGANDSCGTTSYTIGFCRLQFPTAIDEVDGTEVDVFGRVYIAGLTDLSGTNDTDPLVIGGVGYGPDGTDPSTDGSWVWVDGVDNTSYGPASPGYEMNNDEYQAVLTVPSTPGDYDFAFRFTGDGGTTYTYCDGGSAGNSDGYAAADAGQMTASAGSI